MNNWKDRVVEEQKELEIKIDKLYEFMLTETFNSLTDKEQHIMKLQYRSMSAYNKCLNERLKIIGK